MYYFVYVSRVVQYSSRDFHFEGGPKNPLKGISMKFLVLATDAQLGVGTGSKEEGRSAMACRRGPSLRGGPGKPVPRVPAYPGETCILMLCEQSVSEQCSLP